MKKLNYFQKISKRSLPRSMGVFTFAAALTIPVIASPPVAAAIAPQYQVFSFNDLGMHCYDKDFSVFVILPPFNVVHAQVVHRGAIPEIIDNTDARVTYSAVSDANGSINTTSDGKTNFWDYAQSLFGLATPLALDTGLLGAEMPGAVGIEKDFDSFQGMHNWFTASGIPITDIDDAMKENPYPLMRIQAYDVVSGEILASTDVVLPVSSEMHCSGCHAADGRAANAQTATQYGIIQWSTDPDSERAYRQNILILHDAKHPTDLINRQPVLCASCHYSPALDLTGAGVQGDQVGKPTLSAAIHERHGKSLNDQIPDAQNSAIIPEDGTTSCYLCHPGSVTQCLRGAMGSAGITCQDCHGGMLSVAGVYATRTPWLEEPKCQSCHTGDAVNNIGGVIRRNLAYDPADPAAKPIIATNKRFAEQDGTLFRNSLGHGNVGCEGCHGSPHAIWPSTEANDNVAAVQLQGHQGTIIECTVCHTGTLPLTLNGPHGLHAVNDRNWNLNHEDFAEDSMNECKACHGTDLNGTVLAKAAADRFMLDEEGSTFFIPFGTAVACSFCHPHPITEVRLLPGDRDGDGDVDGLDLADYALQYEVARTLMLPSGLAAYFGTVAAFDSHGD